MIYPSEKYVLGLDLGIKTGSLIQAQINREYNVVERWRVLYSWHKGPSIKDPLDSILEFFNRHVTPWINFDLATTIAVDWNLREIYWSANKAHSNVKTYVAGYLSCHAHREGMLIRFIPPADVRSFFAFPNSKTHKHVVQRHFLSLPQIRSEKKKARRGEDHDLDALILAYILDLRMRGEPCPKSFLADMYTA